MLMTPPARRQGKASKTCKLNWRIKKQPAADVYKRQVEEGYLGTVDSDNEHTLASDGANHYSIKGYLDFARRMRGNQQPGEAFGACQGGDAAGPGPENALGDLWRADVEASFGRPSASAERKGPDDDSPFR